MGKFLFGCLLFLVTSQARAGMFVEPYLGYESGALKQVDLLSGADLSGKTTMTDVGLRFGYKVPRGIWFALDYMNGFGGTFTYNDAINGGNSKTNKNDLALTVGYDHHGRFRMYLGYVVVPAYRTVDEGSTQESIFSEGSSYKIGIGGLWGSHF